ncbi:unnamed protein product [Moneuplotes crassus]|uniref:C2 domain-containing protein n=1 Tax=Euplotes crassus TaxID=5936 RepID=A0AAD1UEL3_EUPCR|nr:unnamed protein product [Moneuplotes crassus]
MLSKVTCEVKKAKNLPMMDRKRNTTDAYVEIHWFDGSIKKTNVIKGSLDPEWNESFSYEGIYDADLQDYPQDLNSLSKMDISNSFSLYNKSILSFYVFSSASLIGTVYIELGTYFRADDKQEIKFQCQYPIFHPAEGIRGELFLKLKLVREENQLRNIQILPENPYYDGSRLVSSLLINFFSSQSAPDTEIYTCKMIEFVEELATISDRKRGAISQKYQSSKYVTKSNEDNLRKTIIEACQEVRKNIAKRVISSGGNAVIGYNQDVKYDFKNTKKLSIRGYGTIAFLTKRGDSDDESLMAHFEEHKEESLKVDDNPETSPLMGSIVPVSGNLVISSPPPLELAIRNVTFYTCNKVDPLTLRYVSLVSSRSVKLLSSKTTQGEIDSWWVAVREEMRQHAIALSCNTIMGYKETLDISEEVILISAIGTAVNIKEPSEGNSKKSKLSKKKQKKLSKAVSKDHKSSPRQMVSSDTGVVIDPKIFKKYSICKFLHISTMKKYICQECGQGYVPEIIITTLEPLSGLEYIGEPMQLEAKVIKMKRSERGETNALQISEKILFTEYYLHSQIVKKMKIYSMNALFSFRVKILIGDKFIFGIAQATAMRLTALPLPSEISIRLKKGKMEAKFSKEAKEVEQLSKCFNQLSRISKRRRLYDYLNLTQIPIEGSVIAHSTKLKPRKLSLAEYQNLSKKSISQIISGGFGDKLLEQHEDESPQMAKLDLKNSIASPNNVQVDIPNSGKRFSTITEKHEHDSLTKDELKDRGQNIFDEEEKEMISAPIRTTQVDEDEKLLELQNLKISDENGGAQPFKTLSALPFSLAPKIRNIENPENDTKSNAKNTQDYFEIFKDKSLIKQRDKEIQELIDAKQLSNSTFVIEIEDFGELDSFVTLLDPITPKDVKIFTSEIFPNMHSLKCKPKLMIQSFKFQFTGDSHTPSYQKHQEFISEMNLVYTKAIKYLKDTILETSKSEKEEFKGEMATRQPRSKSMKKQGKYEDKKTEPTLNKSNLKIILSSFKVILNIDEKNEVHVCVICMGWVGNEDCLLHHNEQLEYMHKNKVQCDVLDVNQIETSPGKDDHREPFIIKEHSIFGCLWRRKRSIKRKIHNPLESFCEIDIFIPSFIPGKKILEYKGYIDAHLYIEINNYEIESCFNQVNDLLRAKAKSLNCNTIINYKVESLQIFPKEQEYSVIVSVAGDAVIMLDYIPDNIDEEKNWS